MKKIKRSGAMDDGIIFSARQWLVTGCERYWSGFANITLPLSMILLVLTPLYADEAEQRARFEEYKAEMKQAPGLLRYYTFEEGYGEEVRNEASAELGKLSVSGGPLGSLYILRNTPYGVSRRHYLYEPDATPSPEWTQGRWPGKSALMNGLLQRCVFRSGFNAEGLEAFTLALWLQVHGEERGGGCDILQIGNGHGAGFALEYSHGKDGKWSVITFRLVADGKPVTVKVDRFSPRVWHNLVLVNTGTAIEAYLNGQLAGRQDYAGRFTVTKSSGVHDTYMMDPFLECRDRGYLTIGGRKTSNSGDLRYDLDELAIFDRVLSAEEIARNFERGKPPATLEEQEAEFARQQNRRALLDTVWMQIPHENWGYFVNGTAIPAKIEVSRDTAQALAAGPLTGIFELRDLDGRLLSQKERTLTAADGVATLSAIETVLPSENGIYFLDMKLLGDQGQLIKRLPEMYCIGITPPPPTGTEATRRIPLGRLANINPWTQSMPINRIFAYGKDVEPLLKALDDNEKANPDSRHFICLQFPWPEKMTPEVAENLREFFTRVAEATKNRVWAWELSNEPNGKVSPEIYMEMVKIASPILRRITPDVPIVAPGASPSGLPFVQTILQMGLEEYADILSFHNYVGAPVYTYHWKNTGRTLQQMVRDTCKRPMPIWNSESGILQLPRVGIKPMTWEQGVRSGFKSGTDGRERASFAGSMPTLPEESAAARQVQGMLLDLASGFEVYIKCQSPEMPIIGQVNTHAVPTTMGVALTALATELSTLERVMPLPLASLKDAGVFLEKTDGSRSAVLFAEQPVTLTFQTRLGVIHKGMDMLGNPRQWTVAEDGILTVDVNENPLYLFNVPVGFQQLTPLTVKSPEFLPENGVLQGLVEVKNPFKTPLKAKLSADAIIGADIELQQTVVDLAPGMTVDIPLTLTARQLKRRPYSINVSMTAGDKLIGVSSAMFSSPGVIVNVPELKRALPLDGDASKWEDIPMVVCDDEDSVVHGKPNRAETWLPQWRGAEDLSFTVKLAWVREQGVYFLLQVRDDTLMPAPMEDVGRAFMYDCLELFFDGRKYGERGGPVSIGADQVVVVPQTGEAVKPCTFWTARKNEEQVKMQLSCVGRRTAEGYLIEGRITPKSDLDFKLLPGSQFAMDFLVDDRDSDEEPRKAAMALHGIFNNSTDSSGWGRYELVPAE